MPARLWLVLVLSLLSLSSSAIGFEHFITVQDGQLMDGERPFRFVSFNVPTLLYVEDEMAFERTDPYGLPDEFELRDLYATIAQMGGQVVRAYTIPVRNADFPPGSVTYVEAPGEFSPEAFRAMDLAVALAGEYGIRLVIPLVNNWPWMGGRPQYAAFRGLEPDAFWSERQLIEDFKRTVDFVLNRRNHLTGVAYKDDKAILAWETGNELQNPPDWAIEIGRYIKGIDSNHLLIDGFHVSHSGDHHVWVPEYALEEPAFDLVSTHHYEGRADQMIANLRAQVERIGGRKPLFLGEFGFIGSAGFEAVLDYVISEPAIVGALAWSLRRHHRDGGFFHHSEPLGDGVYRAYHWPGFDAGEPYDERRVLAVMRERAFAIQGRAAPPLDAPAPPELLPFAGAPRFSWRGSAGAAAYDIQRMAVDEDSWRTVGWQLDDIGTPGFALFSDETARPGNAYRYRVIAHNAGGASMPSAAVGPVEITHLTRVDDARNLGLLYAAQGIEVRRGDYRSFKEAHSRLHGEPGAEATYAIPGELLELRLYAYEADEAPGLRLFGSQDGEQWTEVTAEVAAWPSPEENYDYRVPLRYRFSPDAGAVAYVKLSFDAAADIVRAEIDYR